MDASAEQQLSLDLSLPAPLAVPAAAAVPAVSAGSAGSAGSAAPAKPAPSPRPMPVPPAPRAAPAALAASTAPATPIMARAPDPVESVRSSRLWRRLRNLVRLMRLDRPIGIWLLLWPELWALWIAADGHPQRRLLAIFLAGTVLTRSAGCVINDVADRNIDPHVKRTRMRPLAARLVSPYEALALFGVLILAALLLVLRLNELTVLFAVAGAALTISYPLFKRFFPLPQLYLGLCFGWAVPMAFAATLGEVPRVGWVMLVAAILWAGVYDTLYAMVDREDDLRIGVQSSAILFADLDRHLVGLMQLMVLLALLLIGRSLQFGRAYDAGLLAGACFFVWQQWLIRARERDACMRAFQNNNYFGLAVFIGILLEYSTR